MDKEKIYGVISGDLVDSSKMSSQDVISLMTELKTLLDRLKDVYKFEFDFYRGDAFQIISGCPENMLNLAVLIRLWVMKKTPEDVKRRYDVRMAIGFGTSDTDAGYVRLMNGKAQVNSGHTLDEMKKSERIRCTGCWNENFVLMLDNYAKCVSGFIDTWTSKELSVCYELIFRGEDRKKNCERLGMSSPKLSKFITSSHYRVVSDVLEHFKNVILERTVC